MGKNVSLFSKLIQNEDTTKRYTRYLIWGKIKKNELLGCLNIQLSQIGKYIFSLSYHKAEN